MGPLPSSRSVTLATLAAVTASWRVSVSIGESHLQCCPCSLIAGRAWFREKAARCYGYPPLVSARRRVPLELGRFRCFACWPPETCRRAFGVLHKPWENRGQVPAFGRLEPRRPTHSPVLRLQQGWEDVPQLERTQKAVRCIRAPARSVRPQSLVD